MRRKITVALLVAVLALSAVACSRNSDRNSDEVLTEKKDAAGMVYHENTTVSL